MQAAGEGLIVPFHKNALGAVVGAKAASLCQTTSSGQGPCRTLGACNKKFSQALGSSNINVTRMRI